MEWYQNTVITAYHILAATGSSNYDDTKESSGDNKLDSGDLANAAKDEILAKISSLFGSAHGNPDGSKSAIGTPGDVRSTPMPGRFGRRSGVWQADASSQSSRLYVRRSDILRDHNSTDRDGFRAWPRILGSMKLSCQTNIVSVWFQPKYILFLMILAETNLPAKRASFSQK